MSTTSPRDPDGPTTPDPDASPMRGVVVAAGSDEAVEGATVDVADLDGRIVGGAVTVADGRFTVTPLPAGTYRLAVTGQGFSAGHQQHVHPGGRAYVELQPLRLTGTGTAGVRRVDPEVLPAELQGQVFAERSGEPVLDAQVKLRTTDGTLAGQSMTDPAGRFVIPLVGLAPPAGAPVTTHHLEVTATGFEPETVDLALSDEPVADVVVVLGPPKRSPWLWAGLAAGVLALLALLAVVLSGSSTIVPDLVGRTVDEATALLADAELGLGDVEAVEAGAEPGTIVEQSEQAGAEVGTQTAVDVLIAGPAGTVAVPNLLGLRRSAAERAIEDTGLELGLVAFRPSAETPQDRVLAADPGAGAIVDPGTVVDLTLAVADDEDPGIEVPQVVGRRESDALRLLDAGEFEVRISRVAADEPVGIVIAQDPRARTEVTAGAVVGLEISQGPDATATEPEPVPAPGPAPEPEVDPGADGGDGGGESDGDGPSLPDVELPDVELPDVELPDVELPDVELPDVEFPDVELPDVPDTDEIAGFFDRVAEWFRNLFDR